MPKYIPIIIALLSAFIIQRVGLDASLAIPLSAAIVGGAIGILAVYTKDKYLLLQAQEIIQPCKPTTEELLSELEYSLELKYNIKIDDSVKGEIIQLIFGADHRAE